MRKNLGFTMIEVMLVMVILIMMMIVGLGSMQKHILRARDTQRKSDIFKLKVAFEDYYNDNECYPPATILNTCGGSDLKPYITNIPCDPDTKEPYEYVMRANCSGFVLYARLINQDDKQLNAGKCFGVSSDGIVPECQ